MQKHGTHFTRTVLLKKVEDSYRFGKKNAYKKASILPTFSTENAIYLVQIYKKYVNLRSHLKLTLTYIYILIWYDTLFFGS